MFVRTRLRVNPRLSPSFRLLRLSPLVPLNQSTRPGIPGRVKGPGVINMADQVTILGGPLAKIHSRILAQGDPPLGLILLYPPSANPAEYCVGA